MSNRLSYQSTIDCSDIFTEEFQNLLVKLHDKFNAEVGEIRKERLANQEKARKGIMPQLLETSEANGDWEIPNLPEDLKKTWNRNFWTSWNSIYAYQCIKSWSWRC